MKKGFVLIATSDIKKAPWNYKSDDDVLKEKLKHNYNRHKSEGRGYGQIETMLVREHHKKFEVINGNHRLDVHDELNIPYSMVFNIGSVRKSDAQLIAIELNETRFDSDVVKLAKTLRNIVTEFGEEDVLKTLPFSPDDLSEKLSYLQFDWNDYNSDVQLAAITEATFIIMCTKKDMDKLIDKLKPLKEKYGVKIIKK